jgi:hypothetical protein
VGGGGGRDRLGDCAMIKNLGAALADGTQGRRQILLHQAFAGLERRSAIQENCRDIRLLTELRGADTEHVHIAAGQNKPLLREPNRRGHQY